MSSGLVSAQCSTRLLSKPVSDGLVVIDASNGGRFVADRSIRWSRDRLWVFRRPHELACPLVGFPGGQAPGQTRYFLAPPTAADQTLSRVIGVTGEGADEQQTHRPARSGERPRQDRCWPPAFIRRRPRCFVTKSSPATSHPGPGWPTWWPALPRRRSGSPWRPRGAAPGWSLW